MRKHHLRNDTPSLEPTIAAIATPPGVGGIGVVRMSGSLSLSILRQLFKPRRQGVELLSHRMHYGWLNHPETGIPIDEVMTVFMRAPHTYTREDVVEIHCHGSYLVVEQILAAVLAAGARPAGPGEFTKRAFLGGRIDLTQAEAVLELLEARTAKGLSLALGQLRGGLHGKVAEIRQALLDIRAIIEVAIDFPEEDVEILNPEALRQQLRDLVAGPIAELISTAESGRVFREGVAAVILGRPNVGKSSLLNYLLQEERALVTAIPGTTRDTIEETIDIKGLPVRIIDTAGIRDATETVEEMGIRRARQKLAGADLVLLLLDGSAPPEEDDRRLFDSIGNKPVLVAVNKIDITPAEHLADYRRTFPGQSLVLISSTTGAGMDTLLDAIFNLVIADSPTGDPDHACIPNLRHQASLKRAFSATQGMLEGLSAALPPDLLAIELQTTLDHLGDIIGETTTEDVLDTIFSRFCIGK